MPIFIRSLFVFLLSTFLMSTAAFAQDTDAKQQLTINDIAGHWRIEVVGRPNDDFKGTAMIPSTLGKNDTTVIAEVITEDKCCRGRNHARVLQDSRITISKSGTIKVTSEIKEFLLKIEGTKATYYPDDFLLRWQDPDTLVGTSGGRLPVRWIKDELNIS